MKLVPAPLVTMCTAVRNRLAHYNTMRAIILDLHVYCTVVRQWRFTVHGFKVTSRQYRRATPLLLTIQRWSMLSFWFPYCHAHTHTQKGKEPTLLSYTKLPFESWCVKQRMSSKDKETRGQAGVVDRVLESKHVERTLLLWRDFFFSFLGRHDRCFLCKINERIRTLV